METNDDTNAIDIPSSDLLHLLQSHLIECGLHSTSSALRSETGGVGLPGLFPSSKGALVAAARDGRWGEVLRALDGLDGARCRRGYVEDYNRSSSRRRGSNRDGGDNAGRDNNDGDRKEEGGGDKGGSGEDGSSSSSIVTPLERTVAMAHEMTILELAEQDEVELSYATLRMCSEMLDRALSLGDDDADCDDVDGDGRQRHEASSRHAGSAIGMISSRSGDVERRLTAISSLRRSAAADGGAAPPLPPNYYGPSNASKQKRRDRIAKMLRRHVPEIPPKRLMSLLQQSIKWQCHAGTFPAVRRLFHRAEDEDDDDDELLEGDDNGGDDEGKRRRKKKKKHRKNDGNVERRFDLVLGNVEISYGGGDRKKRRKGDGGSSGAAERIPSRPHQTIRLGKKSYIESACFLPDGRGLVTGSSDGFIEVWGEPIDRSSSSSGKDDGASSTAAADNDKSLDSLLPTEIDYEKLRTSDLPYQRKDELMMHEDSAAVLAMDVSHDGTLLGTTSSDGTICVWKVANGKLLRRMERAHGGIGGVSDKGAAVTCIQFSPDGSKILTGGHDSTCREFGLLASRMLKEYRGHKSYVNCCSYVVLPHSLVGVASEGGSNDDGNNRFLAVVTASADGSVRVWDGRTAEPIREINPPVPTSVNAVVHDKDSVVGSKSVHTVVHLHAPANTMVVVPRSDRAYLVSYSGAVLRTFARDDVQGSEFLAANVSPSNRWLFVAADDGKCIVFDVNTGKVEKIIRSFAEECSSGRTEKACEISGIVCHPHRGFVGGFSNDKGQKRGILTLLK